MAFLIIWSAGIESIT